MFNRKSVVLLVVLLALFVVPFAVAQEPTEEAPTPEVIEVEAGEPVIIDTPGDATEIVVTSEELPVVTVEQEAPDYFTLVVAVAAALFSGVLLGGGGVATIYRRALESKPLKDSTEELLAAAVPMAVLEQVNGIVNRVIDFVEGYGLPTLEVVNEVTDGHPNEERAVG